MSTDPVSLPETAGAVLLPMARAAIAARLETGFGPYADAPWLHDKGASFVTLKHAGRLRGCIGTLEAHRTLAADVQANAIAAAFNDPRFKPLALAEFGAIRIEVSVLTQPAGISFESEDHALEQLRPGIDGVIFEYGHHRSTFLPQVWQDFGDRRLFMGHLKHKAGLPPDFWDPAVKLSCYTVSRWHESHQ